MTVGRFVRGCSVYSMAPGRGGQWAANCLPSHHLTPDLTTLWQPAASVAYRCGTARVGALTHLTLPLETATCDTP
jgi:hypothetical protein